MTFSSDFINGNGVPTVRITFVQPSGARTVLDENSTSGVSVTMTAADAAAFTVGATPSAVLNMNVQNSALDLVYTTADIHVEFGYRIGDSVEYRKMGVFATNDSLCQKGNVYTTITAYDAFFWMTQPFDGTLPSAGTPVTVSELLTAVLDGTGIRVAPSTTLPDISLAVFRPCGTIRDCIGQIAAACFMNAMMDGDGQLTFVKPSNPVGYSLNTDMYRAGTFTVSSDNAVPVNQVAVTVTKTYEFDDSEDYDRPDDEEVTFTYTEPDAAPSITMLFEPTVFAGGTLSSESTLLAMIQSDIDAIGSSAVDGYRMPVTFRGFSVELFNGLHVSPFDTFTATNVHDETYTVSPIEVTWQFNGTFATGLTTTATVADTAVSASSQSAASIASLATITTTLTNSLSAISHLTVGTLRGDNATFNRMMVDQITANDAFINTLDAKYISADTANITQEFVDQLFVKGSFVAQEGTTYNLTGLHVNANDITAGTLTVDRLQLQGEDGLYYQLNVTSMGETAITELPEDVQTACQNQLHADSLIAHTITTDQITVNNLVGTGGWINLAEGTFAYGNADTKGFISWDGNNLLLRTEYLRYSEGKLSLGVANGARFDVSGDNLTAYDSTNTPYFNVSASGLSYGNGITVATTDDVADAIASVGGDNNLIESGLNLGKFVNESTSHVSMVTEGEYTEFRRITSSSYYGIYLDVSGLTSGGTYTLSFEASDVTQTADVNLCKVGSWSAISGATKTLEDGYNTLTVTLPDGVTAVRIYFTGRTTVGSGAKLTKCKLEAGSEATPWQYTAEDAINAANDAATKATGYLSYKNGALMVGRMVDGEPSGTCSIVRSGEFAINDGGFDIWSTSIMQDDGGYRTDMLLTPYGGSDWVAWVAGDFYPNPSTHKYNASAVIGVNGIGTKVALLEVSATRSEVKATIYADNTYVESPLYVEHHDSPIGTVVSNSADGLTCPSSIDSDTRPVSITLSAGTWLVRATYLFNSGCGANRQVGVVSGGKLAEFVRVNTANTAYGRLQCVTTLELTGSTTVQTRVGCSAAGSANCTAYIQATRIA